MLIQPKCMYVCVHDCESLHSGLKFRSDRSEFHVAIFNILVHKWLFNEIYCECHPRPLLATNNTNFPIEYLLHKMLFHNPNAQFLCMTKTKMSVDLSIEKNSWMTNKCLAYLSSLINLFSINFHARSFQNRSKCMHALSEESLTSRSHTIFPPKNGNQIKVIAEFYLYISKV